MAFCASRCLGGSECSPLAWGEALSWLLCILRNGSLLFHGLSRHFPPWLAIFWLCATIQGGSGAWAGLLVMRQQHMSTVSFLGGLSSPAHLAQGRGFSSHPHKPCSPGILEGTLVYWKIVKLFTCSFLIQLLQVGFFPLSASLVVVVAERVRTAEFGTVPCSLPGRMTGCSAGDSVGHEWLQLEQKGLIPHV